MVSASTRRFFPSLLPGLSIAIALLALIIVLLWQLVAASGEDAALFSNLTNRDWRVVRLSAMQAGLSVLFSLIVGLSLAWGLSHQRNFRGRDMFVALLSSALVLPTLVIVMGLVTVFGRKGWLNALLESGFNGSISDALYGLGGILIAHTYLNGSFAARSLLNRLETIPAEQRKLARSLNLSVWRRFVLMEWPAVRSTLPGLGATIFLLCFTSFAIVLTLGGTPRYNTLEVSIFEAIKLDFDLPRALDLALLQLLICAVLVLAASRLQFRDTAITDAGFVSPWPERPIARMFQTGVIIVLGSFFILPLMAIVIDGGRADFSRIVSEATFQRALLTSVSIAAFSSVATLLLAVLLAAAKRNVALPLRLRSSKLSSPVNGFISFSGTVYLAVPSLVLGLGFFLVARHMSGSLNLWALIALVIANILMALPFALAILVPAMEKTAMRYDRLARALNITGLDRWHILEWPLLRRDIGYVCAISACLSLGDLGVIALFGSQDFATLPWYLYQKMGSYQTLDASGVALILLALTMIVFICLPRLFREQNHADA